jgi:hypothetical protein
MICHLHGAARFSCLKNPDRSFLKILQLHDASMKPQSSDLVPSPPRGATGALKIAISSRSSLQCTQYLLKRIGPRQGLMLFAIGTFPIGFPLSGYAAHFRVGLARASLDRGWAPSWPGFFKLLDRRDAAGKRASQSA